MGYLSFLWVLGVSSAITSLSDIPRFSSFFLGPDCLHNERVFGAFRLLAFACPARYGTDMSLDDVYEPERYLRFPFPISPVLLGGRTGLATLGLVLQLDLSKGGGDVDKIAVVVGVRVSVSKRVSFW